MSSTVPERTKSGMIRTWSWPWHFPGEGDRHINIKSEVMETVRTLGRPSSCGHPAFRVQDVPLRGWPPWHQHGRNNRSLLGLFVGSAHGLSASAAELPSPTFCPCALYLLIVGTISKSHQAANVTSHLTFHFLFPISFASAPLILKFITMRTLMIMTSATSYWPFTLCQKLPWVLVLYHHIYQSQNSWGLTLFYKWGSKASWSK